jgi:tRNA A-37 threonylcarbamoyl transferase component Bud32
VRWRIRPDLDSPELRKLLQAPDDAIVGAADRLAHSDLVTMVKLPPLAPGQPPLLIRRLNYGRFRHWFRDTFRPTRAERAFRIGWELEVLGIPTARVYAAGVQRRLRPPVRAYLVTEFITRATTLHELFERQKTLSRVQMKNLATCLGRLHRAGYSQRDLKAYNILMVDQVEPWLIDLDGVQKFVAVPEEVTIRDLARLSQEFLGQPQEFQRLAPWFLKHYCQTRGLTSEFRRFHNQVIRRMGPL